MYSLSLYPFPFISIPDFLSAEFIEELREQLNQEEWYEKRNDILELEQTQNLRSSTQTSCSTFVTKLYDQPFRDFVSSLVKFKLGKTVDCIGEIYKEGSYHLCHHSGMAQRRVGFFLFLGPEVFEEGDGGSLNFYSVGSRGQPTEVGKAIVPTTNTLVLFETTPNIFFEISEVLAKDKELLCISGFFRSASKTKPKSFPDQAAKATTKNDMDFVLKDWIDPPYLNPENQKKLRFQFERHHFVGLEGFLRKEKYE